MMKKYLFSITTLFLISLISNGQNMMFGLLGGGLSLPIGSDSYKLGFNSGGNIGMNISNSNLSGRVALSYNSFPFDEKDLTVSGSGKSTGEPFSVFSVKGEIMYSDFKKLTKNSGILPYAFVGAGLYFESIGDIKITYITETVTVKSSSATKISGGAGVGAIFKLSKNMGIFGEGEYNIGSSFGYIQLKLGLHFN